MAKKKMGSVKLTDDVLVTSVDLTADVTGTLPVGSGGTGATSLTGALMGNGSSAFTAVAPGAAGGILRSNGSNWVRVSGLDTADITSGTFADARVAQSNVTQHQAALAIAYTQLTYSGLSTGAVLRATGAAAASFGTVTTAGLADANVTYAKIQDLTALSVLGRAGNTDGVGASIAAGTDHQVLRRSGTTIAFGAVNLAQAAAVTGTLAVGNGGTGLTAPGTSGNVLTSDGTNWTSSALPLTAGLAYGTWGAAGAEAANAIEVQLTLSDTAGTALAVATAEVEVMVSDGVDDAEPSATATIAAAGTPVGTMLAGSGTATVSMRCNSSGLIKVKVTETAAANRYLWIRQGRNSTHWVRANAAAKILAFT